MCGGHIARVNKKPVKKELVFFVPIQPMQITRVLLKNKRAVYNSSHQTDGFRERRENRSESIVSMFKHGLS